MARRDSSDSIPSQVSSQSPSGRLSLSSSAIRSHFSAIASSLQRRLSANLSPPSSPSTDDVPPRNSHECEPPLASITLKGFSDTTNERILSEQLAEEIRLMMPARLKVQDNWDLVYSLDQHGVSLATLYSRCKAFNSPQAGFVVIVKDNREHIFGAYLSDYPHVNPHYYGTGETFLFKFTVLQHSSQSLNLSPSSSHLLHSTSHPTIHKHDHFPSPEHHSPLSMEASQLSMHSGPHESTRPSSSGSTDSTSPQYQFKGFSYTGLNDYMILCTPQFLSVGGGYFLKSIKLTVGMVDMVYFWMMCLKMEFHQDVRLLEMSR